MNEVFLNHAQNKPVDPKTAFVKNGIHYKA